VYQDDWLVAINKPAGLLVHRSPIDKHETRFALQCLRDQIGQKVFPVHRLDKPTSGVLLFALDTDTARHLSEQFSLHQVQKTYWAVVRGFTAPHGVIDHPIKDKADQCVHTSLEKTAKAALTHYQSLDHFELPYPAGEHATSRYTLLALQPQTGRKHQLRRHLKHISHPILGDTTYGDGKHNALLREHLAAWRLLLHATQLQVQHPHSQAVLTLQAALPDDFKVVLEQMYEQTQSATTRSC